MYICIYIQTHNMGKIQLTEKFLEPTIGNFDQNFVDNWYTNLKPFSIY